MLEDLSEPEYANLLFDNHCHVCLFYSLPASVLIYFVY